MRGVGYFQNRQVARAYFLENEEIPIKINRELGLDKNKKNKFIADFSRNLRNILDVGLPLDEGLKNIENQSKNKMEKDIYYQLRNHITEGDNLSTSLSKSNYFPESYVMSVRLGEESGEVEKVLINSENHYKSKYKSINRIKEALIYPKLLIIVTLSLLVMLFSFILPKFQRIFEDYSFELPRITKVIFSISNFISSKLLILIGLFIFTRLAVKNLSGLAELRLLKDRLDLSLFPLKKLRKYQEDLNFLWNLYFILPVGIAIDQALDLSQNTSENLWYRENVKKVTRNLKEGMALIPALKESHILSQEDLIVLDIGLETGRIEENLGKLIDLYDYRISSYLESRLKLIEPIMLILISMFIGSLAVALVLPIVQIYEVIG